MLQAATDLSDEKRLFEILDEVTSSTERLATTASMSYDHPNKFSKIVLLSGIRAEWKLRLHVWWPETTDEAELEDIHNHRWDFASVLLLGDYRADEFTAGSGNVKVQHYHYFSPQNGASFRVAHQGPATLERTSVARLRKGSAYTISHRQLHRVHANPGVLSASLLIQTPPRTDHTSVYADPQATFEAEQIPVSRMSPTRVANEIGRIRDILADEH